MKTLATRRRFLAWAGAGAALTALACQQAPAAPTAAPAASAPTAAPASTQAPIIQTQVVEKVVTATPAPPVSGSADVWTFPQTKDDTNLVWKPLMEKFKKQYPQVDAKVELFPWGGRREKMMAAFAAGTPPDAAYVNTDTLSLFGSNDALHELDSLVPPDVWADYPKGVVDTGLSWKGKRIMIPNLLEITARVANQDLLTQLGVDPTKPPVVWSDVLQLGAQAKAKGYYVTSWSLTDWDEWVNTIWQAGGTVLSDDAKKVLMDQQPAQDALQWIVDLFQKGFVPKEGAVASEQESAAATTVDYFMTGKQVYSGPQNPDIYTTIKQQAPKMKYTTLTPFKNKAQLTETSCGCWGIFNRSKNTDVAARWVNFMVEPENAGFYCSVTSFIPPRTQANDFWTVPPDVKTFVSLNQPLTQINQDMNYFFQEGKTTFAPHFQAAVLGKVTVKQALADGTQELQKIVDAFWAKQK
jgi:multiple sugar transport system substrate-binding protein